MVSSEEEERKRERKREKERTNEQASEQEKRSFRLNLCVRSLIFFLLLLYSLCSILCNVIYSMSRACARKRKITSFSRKGLCSLYYERCPFWLVVSLLFMYKYMCVCVLWGYIYTSREGERSELTC